MRRAVTAVVVAGALCSGCAEGLRFRADERLRFVTPPPRSVVEGPLVVEWRMTRPPDTLFGVFVDRSPLRPGRSIAELAREDVLCSADPACPTREWLRRGGIHLTRRARLVLPGLPATRGRDLGDRRRHEVTVVLLDDGGRRLGESAWSLVLFTRSEDGS